MTTIFGNPGSTEIPFLTDLPSDIDFVLGLHEGSVVGIATGYAIARGEPAFVNLHTAPGLGNAINAIANARDCRAPLVIVVGQQDRRQVAFEPFLTGRSLERLAGEYPVWTNLPTRAQDVPGAIARAYHEAQAASGPALVVVPMGDWLEAADPLAAGAPDGRAPALGRRSTRSPSWRSWSADARVAGAGRRRRRRQPERLGGRGGARRAPALPGLAGAVRRPRRVPPGPPAVRRTPAVDAPADARDAWPATTSWSPSARTRSGSTCSTTRWPLVAPGTRVGGDHRRPGRGAPQPVRAGGGGAGRRRLPGPGRAGRSRARTNSRRHSSARPPRHRPAPGRAAARRPRARRRWPSGCRATWCCVEETPSSRPELLRADRRPRAAGLRRPRQRRPRLRPRRARSACAWAARTGRSSA